MPRVRGAEAQTEAWLQETKRILQRHADNIDLPPVQQSMLTSVQHPDSLNQIYQTGLKNASAPTASLR